MIHNVRQQQAAHTNRMWPPLSHGLERARIGRTNSHWRPWQCAVPHNALMAGSGGTKRSSARYRAPPPDQYYVCSGRLSCQLAAAVGVLRIKKIAMAESTRLFTVWIYLALLVIIAIFLRNAFRPWHHLYLCQ